jgi:hypothetical protein
MADTKISALPASTTPLAGTEVLPIVQGGATKQVSVANLTAGRAVSATQMTLTTGNLIVASGQGIDFSASPNQPGATSELFNDYEEGTYTPALFNMTVVGTPTLVGTYVIVGRLAFVTVTISGATVTNSAGTGGISMPFASSLYNSTVTAANAGGFTGYGNGFISVNDGTMYPPSWTAASSLIVVNATIRL